MPLLTPDPTFYPSPKMAMQSRAGKARLPGADQPEAEWTARCDRRRGSRPRFQGLRPPGRADRHAAGGRRAPSLRLERVQLVPLSLRATPAHGTALPDRAGDQLVADSHPRHQARSAPAEDREGDRAGDAGQSHRLCLSAYGALRTRRRLPQRAGRSRRQRSRRHVHHSTPRRSTSAADGNWTADRRSSRMTSGGTSGWTRW